MDGTLAILLQNCLVVEQRFVALMEKAPVGQGLLARILQLWNHPVTRDPVPAIGGSQSRVDGVSPGSQPVETSPLDPAAASTIDEDWLAVQPLVVLGPHLGWHARHVLQEDKNLHML